MKKKRIEIMKKIGIENIIYDKIINIFKYIYIFLLYFIEKI